MRIGISVAQCGRLAQPAAVSAAARAAEQLGYSSVWVCDAVLDPVGVLAATAAITSRVGLGASLDVGPGSDPTALARSLATVDHLSEGRLTIALSGTEDRLEEVLDALAVQLRRPPVLLDGRSPASLDLLSRRADGWSPVDPPVHGLGSSWAMVRDLAAGHGRDPDRLRLVVRAGILLSATPLGGDRPSFSGDADQVADDVDTTRRIGADEVVLRLNGDLSLDEALDGYARIAEAAELRGAHIS